MKYTTEEALPEIMHRSERIALRRVRRICRSLTCFCVVLLTALVLGIMAMSGDASASSAHSLYGSFLLEREAGGYVLIALIAFVLGVAVTLLCLRYRKKQDRTKDGNKNN